MFRLFKRLAWRYKFEKKLSKRGEWGSFWNCYRGFFKKSIDICGITKENYENFISDRSYLSGHPYNGPYSSIIDNKLWLPLLFKDYKEYIPRYFYFKDKSGFHHLKLFNISYNNELHSYENILDLLKEKKKLIFKHTHSSLGKGLMLLEYKDNKILCNKKEKTKEEFCSMLKVLDQYVVTEFICQHKYAHEIAPGSLNTVRYLLVRDKDKGNWELVRSYHRFGCHGDVVDNLGSGNGVCVYVDVDTGTMKGEGIINIDNNGSQYKNTVIHPNSNINLQGIIIPNFNAVKRKLIEILDSAPFLSYVGIDVAITKESFKVIEINSLTSLSAIQQGGLLKNDSMRKLMNG